MSWPVKHPSVEEAIRSNKLVACSLPKNHLGPHRCDSEVTDGACNAWANKTSWRDKRPCPNCKFVAVRGVHLSSEGERVSLCSICAIEKSAEFHEYQAAQMRRRVRELRAKRAARRQPW